MRAINLWTEYLVNPIGIDILKPRFYWNVDSGVTQTAYQIVASIDNEVVWDSDKVLSSSMTHITYDGPTLKSAKRVVWKVKLWDENNSEGKFSDEAFFEMGLLSPFDLKAKWITGNYKVNKKNRYPVDCFKKEFELKSDIKKARLYITACGLYEVKLNDQKVGDFVLAPGLTDYRKRIQYQTYDVTEMLNSENTLTVQLADGWYRGDVGSHGLTNQYGYETKILSQLVITYNDNSEELIISDDTWSWSNDGPIRFADNKDGEMVDACLVPSYENKAKLTNHPIIPTASNNVWVNEKEHFTGDITKAPNGKVLIDFKQNLAGYIEFSVEAKKGQKIKLRFGEMLDNDGNFSQINIQVKSKEKISPLQQIEYMCKEGLNHYKTTFAVFGFQYVEVECSDNIKFENIEAIAVYSDIKQTGFFKSSSELLNKLVDATVWSTKGNSLDIPTDCPTRERHGWTGDAQIFFETAAYLFDYASFSKKYLNDVYDWQMKSGRLPHIAPEGGSDFYMWTMNGSVGWSDVGVLIPYRFAKIYGDKEILVDYYDRMKRYANFMINRMGKYGGPFTKATHVKGEARKYIVNCGQSYGEWAEPQDVKMFFWYDFAAPHPEVSTAYTAYVLEVMAEIASDLGKKQDSEYFKSISEKCKIGYQALVQTEEYDLDTDRQAQLVRPIAFSLLTKTQEDFAKERLIKALDNYGWRLGTGFLSTPLILDVLADINIDYAYKLLENEEMPGWLFMPKNGATTIWESWEGTQAELEGTGSLNHYSKGAVCEWLFKSMCGINITGENEFTITPKPGGNFTFAEAIYESIYGKVESSWRKEGNNIIYSITIPANCSAIININGNTYNVKAGNYEYSEQSV